MSDLDILIQESIPLDRIALFSKIPTNALMSYLRILDMTQHCVCSMETQIMDRQDRIIVESILLERKNSTLQPPSEPL